MRSCMYYVFFVYNKIIISSTTYGNIRSFFWINVLCDTICKDYIFLHIPMYTVGPNEISLACVAQNEKTLLGTINFYLTKTKSKKFLRIYLGNFFLLGKIVHDEKFCLFFKLEKITFLIR